MPLSAKEEYEDVGSCTYELIYSLCKS